MTTTHRNFAPTGRRPARRAGFTIVELLVAFGVFVGILVAVLVLFNFSYKLARDQTYVSDMQQSLRFGQQDMMRMVRMAGRGGFGRGPDLPNGLAVAVMNEVPANTHIVAGDTDTPKILAGTDVLTIRGIFNSPIYQLNPAAGEFIIDDPPMAGTVRLRDPSPQTGAPQPLQPLVDLINADIDEPLLLVSPLDDSIFAVVELDPDGSTVNALDGTRPIDVTLAFDVEAKYLWMSGGVFPAALRSVAFIGVLEEYRFYVRETYAIANNTNSELVPRLSRAQFFPDQLNTPYDNEDANLRVDLADNILDFQIALGIDTDETDEIEEDVPSPSADDWLFNDGGDNEDEARWDVVPASVPERIPDLFYLRLTTLARTDRPELRYVSPPIASLEDHVLNEPANPTGLELERRRYRRWLMQTVVDMRNL